MPDFDDLYPADGSYFIPREPADQSISRKKEKASTLESISVIKNIIQRLDERIDFYNSVDSIPDGVMTKPEEFMHVYLAYKLVKETLISEKEYLQQLLDAHAPNR